jgi:hypothetical protein
MSENIARTMWSSQGMMNYPRQLHTVGHFRILYCKQLICETTHRVPVCCIYNKPSRQNSAKLSFVTGEKYLTLGGGGGGGVDRYIFLQL